MDRKKRSRSFQDTQTTYQALVEEVLKDYEKSSLIYAGECLQTGALIIQYEETDWVFLKRVLSKAGLVLTPDSRAPASASMQACRRFQNPRLSTAYWK